MPILNITVGNISADAITTEHLGGNYSFAFSNMTGNHPDFNQLGMTSLRYPGGAYTEKFFDIENPNATTGTYIDHNGATIVDNTLIGQDVFFNFCALNDVSVTLIVPMAPAFTVAGYWGTPPQTNRALDPDWVANLKIYVKNTLAEALAKGVTIDVFELGNEYESQMTSREYARVASASADAIQDAINEIINDPLNDLSGWQEPMIAVQVTNEAPAGDGYNRNDSVLAAFTQEGLDAIDAVVSHYYEGGSPQTELVEDSSNHFPVLWDAMALWDVATGRDLDRLISEWNVSHHATDQLGLRQIDPLLDMFTNFMMNGVDMAHLWALQYNQNAMFDVDGWQNDLTIAGHFVAGMIDELPGKQAIEIQETRNDLNIYAFADTQEAVIFVTSLGNSNVNVNLSYGGMSQSVLGSQLMSIASGEATNAPNAPWETTDGAYNFGQSFSLSSYEVLRITIDLNISGTSGNDTLVGTIFSDTLNGGAGNDTLIGGNSAYDIRDVIYGGAGNDTIDGGYGNDELRGDAGNDNITGGFGADRLIGGTGNDVLSGAALADEIFGGDGIDFINGGFGYDRLNGGAEADKFYHLGVSDHGVDWIQDYTAADGDVLLWGGGAATAADFLVQTAETANAGVAGVQEVFVTHIPSGNLLWALVDGDAQAQINIQIAGVVYDLLG